MTSTDSFMECSIKYSMWCYFAGNFARWDLVGVGFKGVCLFVSFCFPVLSATVESPLSASVVVPSQPHWTAAL